MALTSTISLTFRTFSVDVFPYHLINRRVGGKLCQLLCEGTLDNKWVAPLLHFCYCCRKKKSHKTFHVSYRKTRIIYFRTNYSSFLYVNEAFIFLWLKLLCSTFCLRELAVFLESEASSKSQNVHLAKSVAYQFYHFNIWNIVDLHIDDVIQKSRNPTVLVMELRLFFIKPYISLLDK